MQKKIFIFEFVSGGGFNKEDLPISLFCEGFAMLRACIEDFKSLDFEIETLLDERISKLKEILIADSISIVKQNDAFIKIFKKILLKNEHVFIIAPEFQNVLYDLTILAEDKDKKLLSIGSNFIQETASKFKTYEIFKTLSLNTPKTGLIPSDSNGLNIKILKQKFENFKKPIILKPEEGVGAESIFFIEDKDKLGEFIIQLNSAKENFIDRSYIIQEYVSGQDLSVSLIGRQSISQKVSNKPLSICINAQLLKLSGISEPSQYFGGYSPVENIPIKYLDHLVSNLSRYNIEGYFGVDFISRASETGGFDLTFIEINPRLTTSYLGIRNIIEDNIFDYIYHSKFGEVVDFNIKKSGYSNYQRLDFYLKEQQKSHNKSRLNTVDLIILEDIPEIITPAISLDGVNFSLFVSTKEKTLIDSENRLKKIYEDIKKLLQF